MKTKKQLKPTCPECKGSDLDIFPEGNKVGYCFTCRKSVMVVYPSMEKKENDGRA